MVQNAASVTAKVNDQNIKLNVLRNPLKLTSNKNVIVNYGEKATFKAKIVYNNGKNVCSGINVIVKIAGKTYNLKTDKNGYVTKKVRLTPGKYVVTTKIDGKTAKNKITVKKVLKAKSATKKKAKKIKYSAKLKTYKGKAIAGKKITFKIKGKTYKAKTNKKGVATVNFKNLNVGKYKITVKYLKSTVKTILRVK